MKMINRSKLTEITNSIKEITDKMQISDVPQRIFGIDTVQSTVNDELFYNLLKNGDYLKNLVDNSPDYVDNDDIPVIPPPKKFDKKFIGIRLVNFFKGPIPITKKYSSPFCGSIQPQADFEPFFGDIILLMRDSKYILAMMGQNHSDKVFLCYDVITGEKILCCLNQITYFPHAYPDIFSIECEWAHDTPVFYVQINQDDSFLIEEGRIVRSPTENHNAIYQVLKENGDVVEVEARYIAPRVSPHPYDEEAVQLLGDAQSFEISESSNENIIKSDNQQGLEEGIRTRTRKPVVKIDEIEKDTDPLKIKVKKPRNKGDAAKKAKTKRKEKAQFSLIICDRRKINSILEKSLNTKIQKIDFNVEKENHPMPPIHTISPPSIPTEFAPFSQSFQTFNMASLFMMPTKEAKPIEDQPKNTKHIKLIIRPPEANQ